MLIPILLTQIGLNFADILNINKMLNISKIILADKGIYWLYIIIPIVIGTYSYKKLIT